MRGKYRDVILPMVVIRRLDAVLEPTFGAVEWKDGDKIRRVIAEEIPAKVAADTAYQDAMRNSD